MPLPCVGVREQSERSIARMTVNDLTHRPGAITALGTRKASPERSARMVVFDYPHNLSTASSPEALQKRYAVGTVRPLRLLARGGVAWQAKRTHAHGENLMFINLIISSYYEKIPRLAPTTNKGQKIDGLMSDKTLALHFLRAYNDTKGAPFD